VPRTGAAASAATTTTTTSTTMTAAALLRLLLPLLPPRHYLLAEDKSPRSYCRRHLPLPLQPLPRPVRRLQEKQPPHRRGMLLRRSIRQSYKSAAIAATKAPSGLLKRALLWMLMPMRRRRGRAVAAAPPRIPSRTQGGTAAQCRRPRQHQTAQWPVWRVSDEGALLGKRIVTVIRRYHPRKATTGAATTTTPTTLTRRIFEALPGGTVTRNKNCLRRTKSTATATPPVQRKTAQNRTNHTSTSFQRTTTTTAQAAATAAAAEEEERARLCV
jgi:hypothetical protein